MRFLTALAIAAMVLAIGASDAKAAEKTAKLTDPAEIGAVERGGTIREHRLQRAALPAALPRHGFSTLEVQGIETAVRGQILALAARDADRAFGFLTPAIQDYFASSKAFFSTLANQVSPMVRAERFAFAGVDRDTVGAVQKVLLTGPEGHQWLATFKVQRQPDGSWLINGCHVDAAKGQQT